MSEMDKIYWLLCGAVLGLAVGFVAGMEFMFSLGG